MMILNERPTKLQLVYNLASVVIIAADEREYWNDLIGFCGHDFINNINIKCSNRIKWAVDEAKKEGVLSEVMEVTKKLLNVDEWLCMR